MRKIGSVHVYGMGTYTIYLNSKDETHPYWVYREYYSDGKHKRLCGKYMSISNCLDLVKDAALIAERKNLGHW